MGVAGVQRCGHPGQASFLRHAAQERLRPRDEEARHVDLDVLHAQLEEAVGRLGLRRRSRRSCSLSRSFLMVPSTRARTSGWSCCPGWPAACERSEGPTNQTSTPGTATSSSRRSTASRSSICAMSKSLVVAARHGPGQRVAQAEVGPAPAGEAALAVGVEAHGADGALDICRGAHVRELDAGDAGVEVAQHHLRIARADAADGGRLAAVGGAHQVLALARADGAVLGVQVGEVEAQEGPDLHQRGAGEAERESEGAVAAQQSLFDRVWHGRPYARSVPLIRWSAISRTSIRCDGWPRGR